MTLFWAVIYQGDQGLGGPRNVGLGLFAQLQKNYVKFGKYNELAYSRYIQQKSELFTMTSTSMGDNTLRYWWNNSIWNISQVKIYKTELTLTCLLNE